MLVLRLIGGTTLAFAGFATLCLLGLGPIQQPLRGVVALSIWMALATAMLAEASLAILSPRLAALLVLFGQSAILWTVIEFTKNLRDLAPGWIIFIAATLVAAYFLVQTLEHFFRPQSRFALEDLQKIKATRTILEPENDDEIAPS